MNKVLVKLFLPAIDEEYDIWLPVNKKIYNVIVLLLKGINEINDNIYTPKGFPILYNRETGNPYDLNKLVKNTDIENGSELILI